MRSMVARLNLAEIIFFVGDSPRYDMFEHCAFLLGERLATRGDFAVPREMNDPGN